MRTVHLFTTHEGISVHVGGVWSKSSISQKIVPRNRISKSFEGKQFISVRRGVNIVSGTIVWSKLMQLGTLFGFFYRFLAEHFHTLKFEWDFFSRQGHWTLCKTGVYHRILLIEKQGQSSFLFFRRTKFFGHSRQGAGAKRRAKMINKTKKKRRIISNKS